MTYEYLCEACGHAWEAQQSISAAPLKDCPKCGEPRAKRQISRGGGFILKGGGWYSDLYASSSGGPAAESKPEAKSDAKSESTKSESKSEAAKPSSGESSGGTTKEASPRASSGASSTTKSE